MNADEIVRQLRGVQQKHANDKLLTFQTNISAMARDCANLIESLQAQLDAAQRRADAAVEDIYKMTDCGGCDICKHYNPDKNTCAKPFAPRDECFEWRGPQEDGKGEAE